MRLTLDPRARAFVRRLPRTGVYSLLELLLLAALAIQCARLIWTVVTPTGPVGDWRMSSGLVAGDPAQAARLRSVDPFFRLADAGGGAAVVTSLQLRLYGTRVDEATGGGSAILSGPDEVQTSYAVGEEVLPGVVLAAVGYDNVTLSRGGAEERLYIDQSTPAPDAGAISPAIEAPPAPGQAPPVVAPSRFPPPAPVTQSGIESIRRDIRFGPAEGGVRLSAAPGSSTLAAAGLAEGDVVVEAGGRPVGSAADIEAAAAAAGPGGSVPVIVQRDGQRVPVTIPFGR